MNDSIRFTLTNGDKVSFRKWIVGYRPIVEGNRVSLFKSARVDSSYQNFRDYLDFIFMYAGSYSLSKELITKQDIHQISLGDVFIVGGVPVHAVIVLDVVCNVENINMLFLLGQSFMPAQDIHILKNPEDPNLSPWYDFDLNKDVVTPEWVFKRTDLKQF